MNTNWPRLLAAAAVVLSSLVVGTAPVADSSDNFVTLFDVQGPDDVNGQADLVSVEIDTTHLGDTDPKLWTRWTWDETGWSGKNTGDACALFDTDGDGNANVALCATVGGNPAVQTADSPRLYECTADSRNDRCAGDSEISTMVSTCTTIVSSGDTIATCEIDLDDVGGSAAVLLNGCSFNSREPNSNPPDCVLQPGMGVTVIKDVIDDAAVTSGFEVTIDGSGVLPEAIIGDGSFFVPLTNGTHSVAEVAVPDGYTMTSSTCTSGSPSAFTLALGVVESVTCTFVNSPVTGEPSMAVTKAFAPGSVDAGASGNTFSITVENDGNVDLTNVVIADPVDPALTVTGALADLAGDCSATVGNAVSCTIPAIAAGQTATVTVTYSVDTTIEPTTIANTASVTATEITTPTTASDSVDITEDVALTVAKSFTADPVAAGTSSNSFTIVATNGGVSDAENVRVVDTVDPALVVSAAAAGPGGDCSASSGQTVDCTFADVAAAGSATVTVTYDVAESASPATVANTAAVTSDEITTPVTGSASVSVVEDVDLEVIKTFATDPVAAGSVDQTFTVTVTNNGTSDAENVTITDTVAAVLSVQSVDSASADCSASSGQAVDCTVAVLASGGSATVAVTYDVDESASPATITNTASVTSDEVTSPVTGSDDVAVFEDVTFGVAKVFGSASSPAGSAGHTFAIEVTNTGLSDAEGVRVTDAVDPALTVIGISSGAADCSASSGQNVECAIATLAAGATTTVTVSYEIDEAIDPGTVSNTAGVVSDEVAIPVTATGSTEVTEDVAITATKVFSPATAASGTSGNSFVLTVTNTGLSDADNVTVSDLVDPSLEVTGVSITIGGDCSSSSGQTIACSIPSLGGGETAVVTVTYSLDASVTPGPITNSVDVVSDEASTSASATVEVVADVDFTVEKNFDTTTVVAGSDGHTFTINATNSETSDATGIRITDTVDSTLTVTAVSSPTADCSASSGQIVDCTLATLPAGQTATVEVTFAVADTVDASTVSNTASVDANELAAPVTGSDSVEVTEDVRLSAVKTFSDASVAAGSVGHTFTLVVANAGLSDADNVSILDVVPAGLVVTSVTSPDADCSASSGQTISCATPTLGGGDSITVTVGYDVAASAEGATVTNQVTVTSDEATVNGADDVIVVEDVTLEFTKSFADATVPAGRSGNTFALTLTNSGLSDTENVIVTDVVPAPLTIVSVVSPGADCSGSAGQTVECTVASLGPGATITVTVTYDVDESAAAATVDNTADASSDESATSASDSIDIVEDVNLSLTKTFSPATAVAGSTANTFTIAVVNSGLSDTENVIVTDAVDTGLTVTDVVAAPSGDCSASTGSSIECTIASLPAGAAVTLTVTYDVPATTDTSTISNTATASSDEAGPATGSADVSIIEDVVLAATKTFATDSASAGSTGHSFTMSITNSGISTADGISIVDTVSSDLDVTGVSIAPVGDCLASAGNSVDCSITSLGAGQSATVTVFFDVPPDTDAGLITNTAAIDGDELAAPLAPNDTVMVTEDVSLAVAKTFAPDTAAAGTSGNTFTIAVTNSGISDADDVIVTDAVDPTLSVTAVTVAPAGTCAPVVANAVECTVTALAPGSTAVVTVTYDIPASAAAGPVVNVAGAVSDEVTTAITGIDTLTVTEDAELLVTKSFAVDPVVAGSTDNTFSISVTNVGISDADNVSITDIVDAAFTVTATTVAPAGDCSATIGNAISCTVAKLAPGVTATVTVRFDVADSADAGTIGNTASVVSDEITTPVVGSDTVTVAEDVVLSASKSFTVDPVVAGSTANTFTISVANSGLSDADNVAITDIVDPALSVTSIEITPVGDCSASTAGSVDCAVASLAPGGSVTVTVSYDVAETADPATITNTASVDSDELVTPLAASDDLTVVEDVDLSIVKTFATTTATAGVSGYSFAIVVSNAGQSDAENVRVTDPVDADLTVVATTASGADCSASSGQFVDCTFATVPAGGTAAVTVQYDVDASVTTPQPVTNLASAVSDEVTTAITAADTVNLTASVTFDSEKTFAASNVVAGSTGNTFTIAVANSGPSDAFGVTIDDIVDARFDVTGVSIAPLGDCSASSGQTIACSIAAMPVGESTVVTVTYDVAQSAEAATITNSADVDSVIPASTNTVSTSIDVIEDVDLSVSKVFAAATVAAGSTANSFSITVANTGLSDTENVVITDSVDPDLAVASVAISPDGNCSATIGNNIACTVASLGPGASATVTVLYDVDESTAPRTVSNTAVAASADVVVPVIGSDDVDIVEDVELTVTKTFAPSTVAAGTSGRTFTVTVANSGRSDAENVVITDVVHGTLTVVSAAVSPTGDCSATSGNIVSCSVASLASGASATVTVSFDVPADASAGVLPNTAAAISDEVTTPVTGTDSVAVIKDVGLTVAKTFSETVVTSGSAGHTFSISTTSIGSSDATNVALTDAVDAALSVTGIVTSPPGDCSATSGNSLSCTWPTLAAGATATMTVSYDVPASTDTATITNTASVTSDEVTVPVEGSTAVDVVEDVVLEVTKTFAAASVAAGTSGHSFTIAVGNSGSSDADGVVITDTVDPNLTVTGVTIGPAGDCAATVGNTVSCTTASLAPGASASVVVTYDVGASVEPRSVVNTAAAGSDEVTTPITGSDTLGVVEIVDLEVVKTFATASAVAGSSGNSFTLVVSNGGPSDAENVSVTDLVDPRLTVTSVDITTGGDCSATTGNTVDCTIPTLGAGSTATLTVDYDIDQSVEATTILNTAAVTSDEVATPVTGADSINVVEVVDLTVTKTADTATADAGTTGHTFTIVVANDGPSDTENVVVTDTVDPALAVTAASVLPVGDCAATTGNAVECTIASLAAGATATVTVVYDVDASTDPVTVTNTAAAISDEVAVPVEGSTAVDVVEDVDLSVIKAFTAPTVTAGTDGHTVTIEVTNSGSSDAENVVVTDTVDTGLAVSSVVIAPSGDCSASSGNDIACTIPTLAPGASATVTITFGVPADLAPGDVANTAAATSDEVTTPVIATDLVTVARVTDLAVAKSSSPDPFVPGGPITYTIDVSNAGPSTATRVRVTEVLPEALRDVVFSPTAGSYDPVSGDWTGLSIAPGGTVTLVITANIPAAHVDALVNVVVVDPAGGATDPDTSDNTAIDQNPTDVDADVSIAKTVDVPNPVPGGDVAWTIVVTNDGPGVALDATVFDAITDMVTGVSWTCTATGSIVAACNASSGTGDLSATVSLLPGDSATIVVDGTLALDAHGELANTATVSVDGDPETANNTATAFGTVQEVADLQLTKTSSGTSFDVDQTVTYELTATNQGPSMARNTIITDELPADTEFVAAVSGDATCSHDAGVVTCRAGDVPADGVVIVTIGVRLLEAASGRRLVNTASLTSETSDPDDANNTAQAAVDVNPTTPDPPGLPGTGSSSTFYLTRLALLLMVAGVVLVTTTRRRRLVQSVGGRQ